MSLDRHGRMQGLRKGRPSGLWSSSSLRSGAPDAKKRSHRSDRTTSAEGRVVAVRSSAQQRRGLVDIEHVVHRPAESDDPPGLGLSVSANALPGSLGGQARSTSRAPALPRQLRPPTHGALKVGREVRTPAVQAGLATRRLTFREVFACQPASFFVGSVRVGAITCAVPSRLVS